MTDSFRNHPASVRREREVPKVSNGYEIALFKRLLVTYVVSDRLIDQVERCPSGVEIDGIHDEADCRIIFS
jgi:hypothetical protein